MISSLRRSTAGATSSGGALRTVSLLVSLLAANRAWGSCGDYLEHGPRTAPASGDAVPLGDHRAHPPLRSNEPPCRGPFCRSVPEIPSTPPVPVQRDQTREQAISGEVACGSPFRQDLRVLQESVLTLPGYPAPIERPPRLG